MTATEKLDTLTTKINQGAVIIISTMTNAWKIDKKVVTRFEKIGRPLLKVSNESLYMSCGNRYVCIDHCSIRSFS